MSDIHKVQTWEEVETWFNGEAEGRTVFYSPDKNPDWDDLWFALQTDTEEMEIGRGLRSFSLSPKDVEWLRQILIMIDEKTGQKLIHQSIWNSVNVSLSNDNLSEKEIKKQLDLHKREN